MPTVIDLLDWSIPPTLSKLHAHSIIEHKTKYVLDQQLKALGKIAGAGGTSELLERYGDRVLEAVSSFYTLADAGLLVLVEKFSKRKLRYLCLGLLTEHPDYPQPLWYSRYRDLATRLIQQRLTTRVIRILGQLLMDHWIDLSSKEVDGVEHWIAFVKQQAREVAEASGNQQQDAGYYDHFIYSSNGPSRMASALIANRISIESAWSYFGRKQALNATQYFGCVVEEYVGQLGTNDVAHVVASIIAVLKDQTHSIVRIRVMSGLINKEASSYQLQAVLLREALDLVGKPIKSYWSHSTLSPLESVAAERACIRLSQWINRKLVQVLFHEVIDDPKRRNYWLTYADNIDQLYCCGTRQTLQSLKRNREISDFIDGRYKVVRLQSNSTCAIVMYINDHVFVEFSDMGALYIYLKDTFRQTISVNRLDSINDLKTTNMPLAIGVSGETFTRIRKEGRLTHSGNWVRKLQHWMKRYYD